MPRDTLQGGSYSRRGGSNFFKLFSIYNPARSIDEGIRRKNTVIRTRTRKMPHPPKRMHRERFRRLNFLNNRPAVFCLFFFFQSCVAGRKRTAVTVKLSRLYSLTCKSLVLPPLATLRFSGSKRARSVMQLCVKRKTEKKQNSQRRSSDLTSRALSSRGPADVGI